MGNGQAATEKHAGQLAEAGHGAEGDRGEIAFWHVRVIRQAFVVYVALNMAVCALLFAPWAQPRETISGLLGRWLVTETGWKRLFAQAGSLIVDALYFWEVDHCRGVFHVERDAREILYP